MKAPGVRPWPRSHPRPRPHPDPGRLRAHVDRELRPLAAARFALHLRRCAACRQGVAEERRVRALVSRSLAEAGPSVDVREAWGRLAAVSGGKLMRRRTSRASGAHGLRLAWVAGLALALGGLVFLRARVERGAFPRFTAGEARAAEVQDLCCWDLDGGGPGDDGVLTVTLPDERVVSLAIYEDHEGARRLTPGSPLRFGGLGPHPAAGGLRSPGSGRPADALHVVSNGVVTRDFCCADYDGGGPADDGILTVSQAGELVERVLLYEDRDGSRSFTSGDIVRWNGGGPPDRWAGPPGWLLPDS